MDLILSDLHSNLHALRAVLRHPGLDADAKQKLAIAEADSNLLQQ